MSLVFLSVIGFPTVGNAAVPTCAYNDLDAVDPVGGNEFLIDTSNLSRIAGRPGLTSLTWLQWKYAVLNAAESWGDNATGGWFEYAGSTSAWGNDLPPDKNCTAAQQVNVVRVGHEGDRACFNETLARYNEVCDEQNWVVTVCPSAEDLATSCSTVSDCGDGNDCSSGTCEEVCDGGICKHAYSIAELTDDDSFDIQGILTHEFGHAMGLHHPSAENAVMGNSTGKLRKRELYPWDIACRERQFGRRYEDVDFRIQLDGASSFSTSIYNMDSGWVRGTGAIRDDSGTKGPASSAYSYRFGSSTGYYLSSSPTYYYRSYSPGHSLDWFPEEPNSWRLNYLSDLTSSNPYTNINSVSDVRQVSYGLSFSGYTQGDLSYCVDSACTTTKKIKTYAPISTAFDEAVSEKNNYGLGER